MVDEPVAVVDAPVEVPAPVPADPDVVSQAEAVIDEPAVVESEPPVVDEAAAEIEPVVDEPVAVVDTPVEVPAPVPADPDVVSADAVIDESTVTDVAAEQQAPVVDELSANVKPAAADAGKRAPRSESSETGAGGLRFNYRRRGSEEAPRTEPARRRGGENRWGLVRLESSGCVNIVGESFFQPALVAITGRQGWVEVQHTCTAVLVLEPSNPHDPHAIRVEIKGRVVGYLSRKDALSYEPYLRELAKRRKLPCCKAVISGRGQGSATHNMGVFLYVAPPGPELLDGCSPVHHV
ncbi:MAG TPA: HIRAN domain-containing protein [Solirubrobacteraceae bacterium]